MWFHVARIRKHLVSHDEQSDRDFVESVGATSDIAEYVILACEAVGDFYRIPHLSIHGSDSTEYLATLGPWYTEGASEDAAITMFFEERLNRQFSQQDLDGFPRFLRGWRLFCWGENGWRSFGDYCLAVGAYVNGLTKSSASFGA